MLDHRLHPRDIYAQREKRPLGVCGLVAANIGSGAFVCSSASLGSVATVLFGREWSQARQSLLDHRHGTGDIPQVFLRG